MAPGGSTVALTIFPISKRFFLSELTVSFHIMFIQFSPITEESYKDSVLFEWRLDGARIDSVLMQSNSRDLRRI